MAKKEIMLPGVKELGKSNERAKPVNSFCFFFSLENHHFNEWLPLRQTSRSRKALQRGTDISVLSIHDPMVLCFLKMNSTFLWFLGWYICGSGGGPSAIFFNRVWFLQHSPGPTLHELCGYVSPHRCSCDCWHEIGLELIFHLDDRALNR